MRPWSNLASVVYARTYARKVNDKVEHWGDTIERVIGGNIKGHKVSDQEIQRLRFFMMNRKMIPGGRGLWCSGSENQERLGGAALNNCWTVVANDWENFVLAQDLLMLGGGVGLSVEHRYTSKLPRIKKGVVVVHKMTKDADYIVPDSREGWCELLRRVLESLFVTGRSFTYSTICIRPEGEPIRGFGGVASGPRALVRLIEKLVVLLGSREGRAVRPIDAADILCAIGEMVVAGNVRRSAIIVIGDCWDKEFLKAKRWDLGVIPTQRAMANFSVVCSDVDDLHPLFWKTYEAGEPFGIINLSNIQQFGRMGEFLKDTAVAVNPCGEATLEDGEACNLQDNALPNMDSEEEFEEGAVLAHRYGKRVAMETYHHAKCDEVVKRNRRIGTGITGCLEAPQFFNPRVLDRVYAAIQQENVQYSNELGIPVSIRTTLIKPSGTVSKMLDVRGEGIHPGYSRYMIQRIRFSSTDGLIPILRAAGHHMEPVVRFDGSIDSETMVVDFYIQTPSHLPCADEGYDTWHQLDDLLMAQKHWADQSISVTVYYRKEEIPRLKIWLAENLKSLKTISFLCHNDHGFKQAPKEAIDESTFARLSEKIRPIETEDVGAGEIQGSLECDGACPIK